MDDHQEGQDNTQEHQGYAEAEKETRRVHKIILALSGVALCATQSKRAFQSSPQFHVTALQLRSARDYLDTTNKRQNVPAPARSPAGT